MRDRSALRIGASAVAAVGAGIGVGLTAVGMHFARKVLTPVAHPDERVTVNAVELPAADGAPGAITLNGPDAALAGAQYSFIFDGATGHARLGDVRTGPNADGTVTRELLAIDTGTLHVGTVGRVTGWWYTEPTELGGPVEHIEFPVEGGHSWGWVIGPNGEEDQGAPRWAIHVHGRGALPQETLRGVRVFAQAGWRNLVIAYRNDPGAPRGLHGRYGLGLAEYHDVNAAISWARQQGAREVVLVGWSMGGTACLLAANRGPHRAVVRGVVLDSPAIDWPGVLRQQVRLLGLPGWVATLGGVALRRGLVEGAIAGERGTDLGALTPAAFAENLAVPILIHASAGDTFVPWDGALTLAQLRPDLVTLREAEGEHVKLWNTDPHAWEGATADFIARLSR